MSQMLDWLRLINSPRILWVLLLGVVSLISSRGIAEEVAKASLPVTKTAKADSIGSKSKLKKSKSAANHLVSATKSPKDEPRKELPSIQPAEREPVEPEGAKLDLVDQNELPEIAPPSQNNGKLTIGATARVQESQSELLFQARVDTGAASCSMHCEEWKIDEESDSMEENIGKEIRVLISNDEQESQWVDSRIAHCVVVKTSEKKELRYKVPMTFRWKDFEKEVVVTLNNRGHMNYPLLLGRNFLEGDFVVDIEIGE